MIEVLHVVESILNQAKASLRCSPTNDQFTFKQWFGKLRDNVPRMGAVMRPTTGTARMVRFRIISPAIPPRAARPYLQVHGLLHMIVRRSVQILTAHNTTPTQTPVTQYHGDALCRDNMMVTLHVVTIPSALHYQWIELKVSTRREFLQVCSNTTCFDTKRVRPISTSLLHTQRSCTAQAADQTMPATQNVASCTFEVVEIVLSKILLIITA